MQKTWQLVRIELVRKWPFVVILLVLWVFVCTAFRWQIRQRYGLGHVVGVADDAALAVAGLLPLLYASILGAATFHAGEKDGVRFFLYHHPAPRERIYRVRLLTGAALVILLSAVTIALTPTLLSTSWSEIMASSEKGWIRFTMVPWFGLLVYSTAVFFSPLFDSDLITIPISWIYAVPAAIGLAFFGISLLPLEESLATELAWLAGSCILLRLGSRLYRRRWILEKSWAGRAGVAIAFFVGTCFVLFVLNFVDFVDLLYLMGIDLMKL